MSGGVSSCEAFDLSAGDSRLVVSGRCVLTGIVVGEVSATDRGSILLGGAGGEAAYLRLGLAAGETFGLIGFRLACPYGVMFYCEAGEITATVMYE
jgi:hypothetical protein